jgi:2-dehydro-3-deoxyphosphogluconate aldolase/(4S)-4-hydroxy-2-oxoglutarate aldolase
MKNIIRQNPVVAILRNMPMRQVLPYARALQRAGINACEVALNTPDGLAQVESLRSSLPGAMVGAGTLMSASQCARAVAAGAQFILTPAANAEVLEFCAREHVPLLPGVMTPTDVDCCVRYGFNVMKLFPAGDLPPRYIRSLQGPFDGTEYVAVGGVKPGNVAEFVGNGFIGVGIGSNLVDKALLEQSDWDAVTASVAAMMGVLAAYLPGNVRDVLSVLQS